jgi:hypothetical protein
VSSNASSETSDLDSHKSGRLNPAKQIELLEDFEYPIVFYNFDHGSDPEPKDVTIIRQAIQRFADGVGVLAYKDVLEVSLELPEMDRLRFQYPWANDPETRATLGSMPAMSELQRIVETARQCDQGSGKCEDEWNSDVQYALLKLAHNTSKHAKTLTILHV